jgi:hypothetical protein
MEEEIYLNSRSRDAHFGILPFARWFAKDRYVAAKTPPMTYPVSVYEGRGVEQAITTTMNHVSDTY